MSFYVYEHWRPDRDECFYVGKGAGNRAHDMHKRNKYHKAIRAKLGRLGMCVEVKMVASNLTELEAFNLEIERIAYWKANNVDLANLTVGGEGSKGLKWTEKAKAKLSQQRIGRTASEETKKKLSEISKERWLNGKIREKHLENMRGNSYLKGKKFSKETKEKMRQSRIGKQHSAETRAKIAEANRRRWEKVWENKNGHAGPSLLPEAD